MLAQGKLNDEKLKTYRDSPMSDAVAMRNETESAG
jgi:hypothetical protein